VVCSEHVTIMKAEERERLFPLPNPAQLPTVSFDPDLPLWKIANHRAIAEILSREQRGDFLCLIGGTAQKPIYEAVGNKNSLTVEYGIGYYGVFEPFRVFESYTHQAAVYARWNNDPDGNSYDAVIPNYFDPADFQVDNPNGATICCFWRG
jgi:hypothetical protein